MPRPAPRRSGCSYDMVSIGPRWQPSSRCSGRCSTAGKKTSPRRICRAARAASILMAVSNKLGGMVVTTGNKSEMAVGYATLYGDMCGGYNVLKDVYKTTAFELCKWRNAHRPEGALGPAGIVIPERIITKPPSAELKPDQKDEDSLPPYPVLDAILKGLIERDLAAEDLVKEGHDPAIVDARLAPARSRGIQAPPGAARREDHQPRASAATGAIPSSTPSGAEPCSSRSFPTCISGAPAAPLRSHRHGGLPRACRRACSAARSACPTS